MKKENKNKYIPCKLKVVEFDAERGFASSLEATNPQNIWGRKTIDFFIMKSAADPNGTRNQQYETTWGAGTDVWE